MTSKTNLLYETSLRMLLLLFLLKKPENEIRLSALDFTASCGKEFHISDANLSGDNPLYLSNFPGRASLCAKALDCLAETGYIERILIPEGIGYTLTRSGREAARKLDHSPYASQYKKTALTAACLLQGKDELSLIRHIFQRPKDNPPCSLSTSKN